MVSSQGSASHGGADAWLVAGKSVIGATHVRQGKPCQDAILWQCAGTAVVLAAADGHGSARCPHSDVGARIAVEVATAELMQCCRDIQGAQNRLGTIRQFAEDHIPRRIVRRWAEEVSKASGAPGQDEAPDADVLLQYGTTLLAVAVFADAILAIQFGDGDILCVPPEGPAAYLVRKDARLMGNETTSLCTPQAWREARVVVEPLRQDLPLPLILVATDGYGNSFACEEDFLKVGTDYRDFIASEGFDPVAGQMERWLREASEGGSGDDVTLGILCPRALSARLGPAKAALSGQSEATARGDADEGDQE